MKTAVVILNWNTEGFLKRFLPGLLHSTDGRDAEVIVADNASTDGSVKLMNKEFPQVRTLAFSKNLGFTGGYNEAFRRIVGNFPSSMDSGTQRECVGQLDGEEHICRNEQIGNAPEYFVLINSDIEVEDGWLEPLVGWMDNHPECAACAPKLHSWQQKEMFEYAGAAGGYLDKFGYPFCRGRVMSMLEKDEGLYDRPAEVFWATGACLMVRSSVYMELGGLDSRFFAHMEEIDLCWRMKLQGYTVNVVPSSVVWHVGGGTLPATSPTKLFLNYRNNLLMLSNNLAMTFAMEELYELSRKAKVGTGRCKGPDCPGTTDNDFSGRKIERAAKTGCRKACRRILTRRFLDLLSAVVYLLTMKPKYFKSVIRAHKEYLGLRTLPSHHQVEQFLAIRCTSMKHKEQYASSSGNPCRIQRISGIYPKWIVLMTLFKRRHIFSEIRKWEAS